MARVKLQFPDKILFKTEMPVMIDHINYGNHMGNDKFLALCHECRLRYLASINQDELNFYNKSLIMADAELSYKKQVYYGDLIHVELSVDIKSTKSFEFYYKMTNQHEEAVCLAKTGMVFFDYKNEKICDGPEEWLSNFD